MNRDDNLLDSPLQIFVCNKAEAIEVNLLPNNSLGIGCVLLGRLSVSSGGEELAASYIYIGQSTTKFLQIRSAYFGASIGVILRLTGMSAFLIICINIDLIKRFREYPSHSRIMSNRRAIV